MDSRKRSLFRRYGLDGILVLALALATLAVYWRALDNQFVNYDDDSYVTDNTHVKAGLTREGFTWALTTMDMVNWHPLTWLSFELDYQLFGINHLFGLEAAPGFHLTNILLHVANTILLYLGLRSMTGVRWASALVAGLFALHPLHVESVAWVAERKDVLSTLFWMLTMVLYPLYVRRLNVGWYLLIILSFTLGLAAKSMLVTLPFVLLLLDFWPLRRRQGGGLLLPSLDEDEVPAGGPVPVSFLWLLLEKIPLFGLAAASSLITMVAQHKGGEVNPIGQMPLRLENAVVSYVSYLDQTIYPRGMVPFYPFPRDYFPTLQVVMAGLLLLFLTLLAVVLARRCPYLAVGWFWYLGTLVPVIGIVQVIGGQAKGDRYTYISLIGLFLIVAWIMVDLLSRWRLLKAPFAVSMAAVLAGCALITSEQITCWHDSIALWQHTLDVNPTNHLAYLNLGKALHDQDKVDEAMHYYEEAARCNPNFALARYNLGCGYAQKGKMTEAIQEYEMALRIDPNFADAHNNLGWVLYTQGKVPQAIEHYEAGVRINPNFALCQNNLGLALMNQSQPDQAIPHFEAAIRSYPQYPDAHVNLGWILYSQGKVQESIPHFQDALAINPNLALAHHDLGLALLDTGDQAGAAEHFEAAVRVDPNDIKAHHQLASTLISLGKVPEAMEHSQAALQNNRGDAEAWYNLGLIYCLQERPAEGLNCFQHALSIQPSKAKYYYNLACSLMELDKTVQGNEYYQVARRLDADWPQSANRSAWKMATHPDPGQRNGLLAVWLAKQACESTGYQRVDYLETLAAAYAETGRFDYSKVVLEKALTMVSPTEDSARVKTLHVRLDLYAAHQPWREE